MNTRFCKMRTNYEQFATGNVHKHTFFILKALYHLYDIFYVKVRQVLLHHKTKIVVENGFGFAYFFCSFFVFSSIFDFVFHFTQFFWFGFSFVVKKSRMKSKNLNNAKSSQKMLTKRKTKTKIGAKTKNQSKQNRQNQIHFRQLFSN